MAAWREEDHPRDERGRFTVKGAAAAVSIKRTLAHVRSASDSDLLDVFARVSARARLGKRDEDALRAIDAELERRQAGGEPEPTPEQRKVEELLSAGASYEDAYREAYGREGDAQDSGDERLPGETREQMRHATSRS